MKYTSSCYLLIILISLAGVQPLLAQDAADFAGTAVTMSMTNPGGSARIQGLGGAQTALGGDISSVSSNPAGLGFFNRSEASVSLGFNYMGTNTTYLGTETNDGRLNINFPNLGVVIKSGDGDGDFLGGSFGVSINRIADLQNQITYEGYNFNQVDGDGNILFDPNNPADFTEYAVLSSFSDNSGNISFDNDFAELAYETFLTDYFIDSDGILFFDRDFYAVDENGDYILDNGGNVIPAYPEPSFPTLQRESIDTRGAIYQTSFAYGGNYNDKFYFGGNIGLLTMTQEVDRVFTEIPTGADLNSLVLEDSYELNGVGINATLGVIGRVAPGLLLGASYTTPSVYGIEQIRSLTLSANFADTGESFGYDYEPFNYTLVTPAKFRLGASYFIGKNGFITADAERINYAAGRLSSNNSGISFNDTNRDLDDANSTWNFRLGGELRFDMFRVRGGYAYMADPVDNDIDQGESRFTFGAGLRNDEWYADMAVTTSGGMNQGISPYPGPVANVEKRNTVVAFTLGFFF